MRANWAPHERIAQLRPNATARAAHLGTLGHLTSSTAVAADRNTDRVETIAARDETAVRAVVGRHNRTSESWCSRGSAFPHRAERPRHLIVC